MLSGSLSWNDSDMIQGLEGFGALIGGEGKCRFIKWKIIEEYLFDRHRLVLERFAQFLKI